MLASFSYDGPTLPALFAGLLTAVVVLVGLWLLRSIVAGLLGGGISGAAIAWFVFAHGRGDMVELMQIFGACVFGITGTILGGLAGLISKLRHKAHVSQVEK